MKASLAFIGRVALCLCLNVTAFLLALIAHINSIYIFTIILLIAGLLVTLFLSIWYQGNFLQKIAQSSFLGFSLSSSSFICGYLISILYSLEK